MRNTTLPGPAADFDHPIDILDGCHERIRRQCVVIQRIAEHVAEHGAGEDARQAARGVVRYFDTAGAYHHQDEEEDLFPALVHAVPNAELAATRVLIDRLQADHVRLEASWREMRGILMRLIDAGEVALDMAAARAFSASYDRHIGLEEADMLPLARRVLDTRTIARLGERMAARRGAFRPS
jgi:hemerythrin-like domain-containing protein